MSYRTLINKMDFESIKLADQSVKLYKTERKFRAFGSGQHLPVLGWSKLKITAKGGTTVITHVYVVASQDTSLLGLREAEALGIVDINPLGAGAEGCRSRINVQEVGS